MGTKCLIGCINVHKGVKCISCHYDGYVDGVGLVLNDYYQNLRKIKRLLDLGNISVLGKDLYAKKGLKHSYMHPVRGVTIAYRRDRGDYHSQAKRLNSLEDFFDYYRKAGYGYAYLYDEILCTWFCLIGNSDIEFRDLSKEVESRID